MEDYDLTITRTDESFSLKAETCVTKAIVISYSHPEHWPFLEACWKTTHLQSSFLCIPQAWTWGKFSEGDFSLTESIVLCSTRQSTSNPHLLHCSGFVLHGSFFQGFSRNYFPSPLLLMQGMSAGCVRANIGPKLAMRWLRSGPTGFGKQCSTLTYPSRTQPWLKTHFWQNTSQKECRKERARERVAI